MDRRKATTHVVFEPLDFLARLAALVPKPRVHLTRYHGVFAPHSPWRAAIMPAGRGSRKAATDTRTPAERHRAMRWAPRLKRVFKLDLATCEGCGGRVRVIASVEDPAVIGRILALLENRRPAFAAAGLALRGLPGGALNGLFPNTQSLCAPDPGPRRLDHPRPA